MAILRITRFTADPAHAEEEVLAKRAELLAATRKAHAGLTDARLVKLEDGAWLDVWQWESEDAFQRAVAWAHDQPLAAEAFALVRDVTAEKGELVA